MNFTVSVQANILYNKFEILYSKLHQPTLYLDVQFQVNNIRTPAEEPW